MSQLTESCDRLRRYFSNKSLVFTSLGFLGLNVYLFSNAIRGKNLAKLSREPQNIRIFYSKRNFRWKFIHLTYYTHKGASLQSITHFRMYLKHKQEMLCNCSRPNKRTIYILQSGYYINFSEHSGYCHDHTLPFITV